MADNELFDALSVLFAQAGKAHHEAFVDVGGADPDWPLWYAEFLLDKLNEQLGAQMTRSDLCYLLVSADREMKMLAPGSDWHAYFSRFFVERYS